MTRNIGCRVYFDWDFNGAFTEESANLVSANGDMRVSPPGESISGSQGMVDQCVLEMRNVAGRYSPLNPSGALYAYLQNGGAYHVPVRVEITIDGSNYFRVFTGVAKLPRETGRSVDSIPVVRFDCRGREEIYLQKKATTPQQDMVTHTLAGWNEAQSIEYLLNYGGAAPTVIDSGLVVVPWVYLDEESVIEEVWAVAAAALGRFYCNANGEFVYENNFRWLTAPYTTSQQTFTLNDWTRFEAYYDDSELFNVITVEYSGREPQGVGLLWEPDEPVQVPAGGRVNMIANYSQTAYSINGITYKGHSNGGIDITSNLVVNTIYASQRAAVEIINNNATLAATVFPLQITGRILQGSPSADETRTSAAHGSNGAFFVNRGDRTRSVRGNFYVQSRAQAGMIAQFLLDRHEYPRLRYDLSGVPGDPRRRPGDRITVNDTSVMGSGRAAYLVGVTWRLGGMSYTMDIEAIDADNLFKGYGTGDPYFILGTHTVNNAGIAGTGKVWY